MCSLADAQTIVGFFDVDVLYSEYDEVLFMPPGSSDKIWMTITGTVHKPYCFFSIKEFRDVPRPSCVEQLFRVEKTITEAKDSRCCKDPGLLGICVNRISLHHRECPSVQLNIDRVTCCEDGCFCVMTLIMESDIARCCATTQDAIASSHDSFESIKLCHPKVVECCRRFESLANVFARFQQSGRLRQDVSPADVDRSDAFTRADFFGSICRRLETRLAASLKWCEEPVLLVE